MKYIIELEDEPMKGTFEKDVNYYRCKQVPYWSLSEAMINKLTPYPEPDRKAIEDEVWEFASMLMNMHPDVAEDIYWSMNGGRGIGVAAEMTYQEAKSKYEAWKKQKDEIHVGDEVTSKFGDGVVIDIVADESVHILGKDGHWNEYAEGEYRKTGRHFPEVAELLEKMREDT